jgi:hypothetical protein
MVLTFFIEGYMIKGKSVRYLILATQIARTTLNRTKDSLKKKKLEEI